MTQIVSMGIIITGLLLTNKKHVLNVVQQCLFLVVAL
jgi:hypothetical protein